jgi:hypothetical protein
MIEPINWSNPSGLPSYSYRCGYCGADVASEKGWVGTWQRNSSVRAFIYICHRCTGTTLFDVDQKQWPGVSFGNSVSDIDDRGVAAMYDEARGAFSSSSYTAAVLCCRKLLMHIAVAKKAPAGKNFIEYVEYLAEHHYVPPDAKPWVDHIRKAGNEANHEIKISSREEAEELISFSEMLLKVIFEFPASVRKKVPQAT